MAYGHWMIYIYSNPQPADNRLSDIILIITMFSVLLLLLTTIYAATSKSDSKGAPQATVKCQSKLYHLAMDYIIFLMERVDRGKGKFIQRI